MANSDLIAHQILCPLKNSQYEDQLVPTRFVYMSTRSGEVTLASDP